MGKINSRAKGANFELDVAKVLTTWWGWNFRRVPLSGGYDKRLVVGDLWIADDKASMEEIKNFPFCIEAKKREEWDFNSLFFTGNNSLSKYWLQAKTDAAKLDKIPLLIFSKNRYPMYIMWDETTGIYNNEIERTTLYRNKGNEIKSVALLQDWMQIFFREWIEWGIKNNVVKPKRRTKIC